MTDRYRPANGTEGEMFMSKWCACCERNRAYLEDGEEPCDIILRSVAYDADNPEYPEELVGTFLSDARCLAFVPVGEPVVVRCSQTFDMFDDELEL